jgi:hypothetical protein
MTTQSWGRYADAHRPIVTALRDRNDKYFKIENIPYYIYYDNIDTTNDTVSYDNSYKNYIVFNEDIITNNPFSLYDENNNLVFKLYEELPLHIIIKDVDRYFVEYDNRLLYIKKEDVKNIVGANNTNEPYADAIASLNYHFFYDDTLGEICNETICLKTSKFEEQLKYLSDNNYYAVKMKDLELFVDGKIRLPKNSVSLTIDDGALGVSSKAIPLLEKYKMSATLFLITAWWSKDNYKSPYLEVHSHGYNLHTGTCNGDATIKCLAHDELLKDLKTSRDIFDQSPYFCYPFYQYNDYAISVLKEAGFRMAFTGGFYKIKPGANKFTLPRYVIYSYTTINDFIKMIR